MCFDDQNRFTHTKEDESHHQALPIISKDTNDWLIQAEQKQLQNKRVRHPDLSPHVVFIYFYFYFLILIFLAVPGLHCTMQAFSGWVPWASLVSEHGSRAHRFSYLQHVGSLVVVHRLSWPWHVGSLVPRPRIETAPPALDGRSLTAGSPEKSISPHFAQSSLTWTSEISKWCMYTVNVTSKKVGSHQASPFY